MEEYHEPVLLREVIEALDVKKGGWYLDCTLGDGGHSLEILRLGGNVLGIDVDPEALKRAKERLGNFGFLGRFRGVQGNFRDIKDLMSSQFGIDFTAQTSEPCLLPSAKRKNLIQQTETKFAGVLFDLGVSSLQLENPERGFSFGKEGPLDMRMDPNLEVKALDLVNGLNKGELYELFNKLGQEKYYRAISDALVRARQVRPIRSTTELAKVVERVVGRKERIHPATRIFQALRIAVNDELNALREVLPQALEKTLENGHILVISFHSLEDRIVKDTFRKWQDQKLGWVVTKKPITPSLGEINRNPRSRSAKLRIFKVKHDYHQKIRSRAAFQKVS